MAAATWDTVQSEKEKGCIGNIVDVSAVDLDNVLLVDTFGIWVIVTGGR